MYVFLHRQPRIRHLVTDMNYSNWRRVTNSKWARELVCSFPRDLYRHFAGHFDDENPSYRSKFKHFPSSRNLILKTWSYLFSVRTDRARPFPSLSVVFFGIRRISGTLAAVSPSDRKSADELTDSAHAHRDSATEYFACCLCIRWRHFNLF